MNQKSNQPFIEFLGDSDIVIRPESDLPGLVTLHSKREPLVIREAFYKGNHRISLRFHYPDKRDTVYRPGRRGVEIPLEAARLVAQGITDLMDLIEYRDEDLRPEVED